MGRGEDARWQRSQAKRVPKYRYIALSPNLSARNRGDGCFTGNGDGLHRHKWSLWLLLEGRRVKRVHLRKRVVRRLWREAVRGEHGWATRNWEITLLLLLETLGTE
jgi:hypothetical protein